MRRSVASLAVNTARALLLSLGLAAGLSPASAQIYAAVAPGGRTVVVNTPATYFVTILNAGTETARNCRIENTWSAVNFSYQTTDAQNALIGTPNTPVDIPASGQQQFIISLSSQFLISQENYTSIRYVCDGQTVRLINGVNTFLYNSVSSSQATRADIIPIAVTPSGDGVIRVQAAAGTQIMAAAALNLGVSQDIVVAPRFQNGARLPFDLTLCATGAGGACIAPPSASVTRTIGQGAETFTVFARALPGAGTPFWPADARVELVFRTVGDSRVVGLASAAVTAPPAGGDETGVWFFQAATTEGNTGVSGIMFRGLGSLSGPNRTNVMLSTIWRGLIPGDSAVYAQPNAYRVCDAPTECTDHLFDLNIYPEAGGRLYRPDRLKFDPTSPSNGVRAPFGYPATGGGFFNYVMMMTRDPVASERDVALASLAGSYTVLPAVAASASASTRGSVTIAADGSLSGAFDGCTLGGRLVANPAGKNLIGVDGVSLSGCTSARAGADYGGLAALLTNVTVAGAVQAEVLTLMLDNQVSGFRLDLRKTS
ncbi:hypothetical protein GC169_04185 [bacterium]|nr:hypothetical protein [bacterium]